MCHTEHIIHIGMLTPVFLLGIKHQKVPHRAYSDDSDAHQFCVSQHQDAVVTGQVQKYVAIGSAQCRPHTRQIRQPAPQSKLRKLRQRACSACFVPVMRKM